MSECERVEGDGGQKNAALVGGFNGLGNGIGFERGRATMERLRCCPAPSALIQSLIEIGSSDENPQRYDC
jgi:hypothetical protein